MILNRPGCELLEIFLRDFAFILQSYGIDVKLALLEQNHLDAEGGIASYMQKYVNECDYILIMFSEKTEGKLYISLFTFNSSDRESARFNLQCCIKL